MAVHRVTNLVSAAFLSGILWNASCVEVQTRAVEFLREHLGELRQRLGDIRQHFGALRQIYPTCALEPVPAEDEFIAATIHDGETLANVLISPSAVSTIVRVNVTPGAKPITAFLAGSPGVIWDFEGDVDRIRRVAVVPGQAGVRGIPAGRVEFPKMPGCELPSLHQRRSGAEDSDRSSLLPAIMFGRAPDRDVYQYAADQLNLPGATFVSKRLNRPSTLSFSWDPREDLYLYHPGGFRELDPQALVSVSAITVPKTRPRDAGLIQLEETGAIRRARAEEILTWIEGASRPFRSNLSPDFTFNTKFDYVITQAVELPARSGKSFLVLPGVPAPRGVGTYGNACVGYMDGFTISDEQLCLGEREELRYWRALRTADDHGRCRVLLVSSTTSLQAVSVYKPKGSHRSTPGRRSPMPIDVRVRRPGEVVLVLNTYDPAIWRISLDAATRVAGVILTGFFHSTVEGLPAETPLVAIDSEGNRRHSKSDPECAPFNAYLGATFRGGPAVLTLDRQVKALTGRGLDGLQSAYSFGKVEIR
jgi:hypothetical protein